MKIGHYHRTLNFYLGQLKVAYIYHYISYGIKYDTVNTQTKYSRITLAKPFCDNFIQCASMAEAMGKLQDMCGQVDFYKLRREELIDNDVKEVTLEEKAI